MKKILILTLSILATVFINAKISLADTCQIEDGALSFRLFDDVPSSEHEVFEYYIKEDIKAIKQGKAGKHVRSFKIKQDNIILIRFYRNSKLYQTIRERSKNKKGIRNTIQVRLRCYTCTPTNTRNCDPNCEECVYDPNPPPGYFCKLKSSAFCSPLGGVFSGRCPAGETCGTDCGCHCGNGASCSKCQYCDKGACKTKTGYCYSREECPTTYNCNYSTCLCDPCTETGCPFGSSCINGTCVTPTPPPTPTPCGKYGNSCSGYCPNEGERCLFKSDGTCACQKNCETNWQTSPPTCGGGCSYSERQCLRVTTSDDINYSLTCSCDVPCTGNGSTGCRGGCSGESACIFDPNINPNECTCQLICQEINGSCTGRCPKTGRSCQRPPGASCQCLPTPTPTPTPPLCHCDNPTWGGNSRGWLCIAGNGNCTGTCPDPAHSYCTRTWREKCECCDGSGNNCIAPPTPTPTPLPCHCIKTPPDPIAGCWGPGYGCEGSCPASNPICRMYSDDNKYFTCKCCDSSWRCVSP